MITTLRRGQYRLIETRGQTKIVILDGGDTFAWINAGSIGGILVTSHKTYKADYILAIGSYRLYKVDNEQDITDQLHLELYVGDGVWQGYLLPTGLPTNGKKKNRIIPTGEIITVQRIRENQGAAWLK